MRSMDYNFYPELRGWLKLHTAVDTYHGAKKTCENEGMSVFRRTIVVVSLDDFVKLCFVCVLSTGY